jgi:regulator of nucleoside diphosphate kinase
MNFRGSNRISRCLATLDCSQESVMPSKRLLNREDRVRVRRFISLHEARLAREEEALALLSAKLERGQLIDAVDFPADVVTLHSQVRMRDADSGRLYVTTVDLPRKDKPISDLPLLRAYPKLALLGARVGDDIVWRAAGRLRRARIEQILFQPEASARSASSRMPRTPNKVRTRFAEPGRGATTEAVR